MVTVHYQGGESRLNPGKAVDYMVADADGVELYAELTPIDGDETGTYEELKSEIIDQAITADIDTDTLKFWYDRVLYNQNQLATALGVTRAAITGRLNRGTIQGDYFTADGKPLFTHDTVERLKDMRYE